MARSIDTPIICPILIGRAAEIDALRRCFDKAAAGRGRTVLVAGEAGIGKSRLVADAVRAAREAGAFVLVGRCFERDRTLPLQPVFDLARFAVQEPSQAEVVRTALADVAPDLARVLPEIDRLAPGVVPAPALGPAHDRRRAVHALTKFIAAIAIERPALLVVEDAHWSDEATLDAVQLVATAIHGVWPVLLVVTYRGDERGQDLDGLLARLNRDRLASTIRLEPLLAADVRSMLRAMTPAHELPERLITELTMLAEGNPFFVEELLRSALTVDALRSSAIPLPASIDDAVRLNVERLDAGTRETLVHAAVIGRRFDFALLQMVGRCDEAELLRRIKVLVAAGLLVEAHDSTATEPFAGDRFAFRHELTRQAVYMALLSVERRALHRMILQAIRHVSGQEVPERDVADLAHHAFEAGAWEEALAWGERAGDQALVRHASRAAVEHFTQTLAAAARVGAEPDPALHRKRGAAFETLGDFDAARHDFERAVQLARSSDDRAEEAEGLLALGELWGGRNYAIAGEHLKAARAAAESATDRSLLARCLNRLGNWHGNLGRPTEAFRCHQDALAIFRSLNDPAGEARTLDLLGIARFLAGDMDGSIAAYRQAVPLLRSLDDRQTLCNALAVLSLDISSPYLRVAPPTAASDDEGRQCVQEAIAVAREIGWLPGEAFALCCAARFEERRPSRGIALARQALHIADEIDHAQWRTFAHDAIGRLSAALLDWPAAREHLEQARAFADRLGSVHWRTITAADLALLLADCGDTEQAARTLAAVIDRDTPLTTIGRRQAWHARAELALAQGDFDLALSIVDRLLTAAIGNADSGAERMPYLAFARGKAFVGLERFDDADIALREARDAAAALGFPTLLWRVHLTLGMLARRRGDRAGADRAFDAARRVVDGLAADIADEATRETFVRRALAMLPPGRPLSPRNAARAAYGGLTERERAVAALIAAGRKNREIAADLFIQERTAATHVANILAKLGLSSRAQIAIWAAEHGLSPAAES